MKNTPIVRLIIGLFVIPVMAFSLALFPQPSLAQPRDNGQPAAAEKFSREELAQMLGPIALYPDKLLAQVLMASTYPIEVIEADRWVKRNPKLQGDPLDRALLDRDWDASVKAICHFPAILALMSERITETTNLGNAFLVQEAEVMDMVQALRAKAHAQGNLTTTPQQKVVVEKETIFIEPANPRVIYVPYYDPFYVYGPWWYPAYYPYYWGPPGVRVSLGVGVAFWPGISFGFSFGNWSYFDWHRHTIYIHDHARPGFVRHDRWYAKSGRWLHAPVHRRGVAYRDKYTATKYGQYSQRHGAYRGEVRGYPERRETDREGSRLGEERSRIDQGRRTEGKSRVERSQQEQQRVERELKKREPQLRQQAGHDRAAGQGQAAVGRAPQDRQRVEPTQQLRQPGDQKQTVRRSVVVEQPQRRKAIVFDQPETGQSERQSSERGRFSRQERGSDSRDSGRWGGVKNDGRNDGGHKRR